jgi:chemotaxis protein CheC
MNNDDGEDLSNTGIELTTEQQDVLNELINIGFGRAASSLSVLVNQRVLLNVPHLQIYALEHISQSLSELSHGELVNVHQVFHGKLTGHALLLLDVGGASRLVDLMNGGTGQSGPLTSISQEALAEVGNIVINAFLGAFGNLLKIHLSFTIPSIKIETLAQLLQSLMKSDQDSRYAMVVKIRFQLSHQDISGYLVVVMGARPLEALLNALRKEGMLP